MKKIQILGPFNSGTNLITKILKKAVNESIALEAEGHTYFWKHNFIFNKIEKFIKKNPNILFICMYRDLFEWIISIQKKSYKLRSFKFNGNIRDNKSKYYLKNINLDTFCELNGVNFKNPIALYNYYYKNYIILLKKYKNVICLSYSKIIKKETNFNYLTEKLDIFDLTLNNNGFKLALNRPSKNHGKPVQNSEQALKKNENVIKKFSKKNINLINKDKNKKVINYYNNQ